MDRATLMKIKDVILAATNNKEALSKVDDCTCYHCLNTFETKAISKWCDGGLTAICPNCGVDSIIQGIGYNEDFLVEANNYWFE